MQNRVKELRISKKLNQNTLADILGYSQQTISRIENCKSIPDIETMQKIANYFEVSLDYLMCRNDIKEVFLTKDELHSIVINNYEFFKLITKMNSKRKTLLLHIAQNIVDNL